MAPTSRVSVFVGLLLFLIASIAASAAVAQSGAVPQWLRAHVGTGDGQIAPIVLERARAHYQKKRRSGAVKNPCYMAMDATRPSMQANGQIGRRYYIICESQRTFRAISSGYGNGRKLPAADFSNGRQCARNFSNALGSNLTAGGRYVTAETRTSFKGFYTEAKITKPFYRPFLVFDGEGETRNARDRAIGGHQAAFLRWQCRLGNSGSRHVDADGYVPFGRLVDYTSGRSNGCTTWSEADSKDVLALVEGNPTTLYIYPESKDIDAVRTAIRDRKSLTQEGLYWNSTCLSQIGAPRFWPKRKLQPIIRKWRKSLPQSPARVLPICGA
ncbi:hypothetical protein [Shimia ponticola]|uniref:hypothetical protein n=1 Tax=Shimia ponticola TaxID=2582893 RepID=UPI0011BD6164|nr:hypothetical protein [Shimia ponticola]